MPGLRETYVGQATDREGRDHWSGPPEMVDRIAALLETESRHVVLDVGCGLGGPARRLASLTGCTVVGIDVLEPLVRLARERSTGHGENVFFLEGSAESMPVPSEAVDQVWCLGAVAHFPARRPFAAEVARVLAPAGSVAITELFWDGEGPPAFEASAPSPWHPVTTGELARELRLAGLRGIRVLPWPGEGIPGALDVGDRALAADVREGRLAPAMVVARKSGGADVQETRAR